MFLYLPPKLVKLWDPRLLAIQLKTWSWVHSADIWFVLLDMWLLPLKRYCRF